MLETLEETGIRSVLNLLNPRRDYIYYDDPPARPVTGADGAAYGWPASAGVTTGAGAL